MNLRQLKKKIKSVQNVGQITKAMQLVSAVKMKKAQTKALGGKPYRDALEQTIARIAHSSSLEEYSLQKNSKTTKELVIVLSSNKGLCGIFNFNLFRFFSRTMQSNVADYEFVTVGTKAQQFLTHAGASVIADFSNSGSSFEDSVTAIFRLVKNDFEQGKYKTVSILYNRFISSLVYKPVREILLPFSEIPIVQRTPGERVVKELEYSIEPTPQAVLKGLLDFYLESKIRGAVQESEASEHSARMIAMKNATDNAKDLVHNMTLLRNGLRQERITNELLDMNTARLAVSN